MQLGFSGHCYATETEALSAFQKGFPVFGDTSVTSHISSSIDGSGLLTYSLKYWQLSSISSPATKSGTIQLATCDPVDAPVFDPVAAGGVFAFFFLGVAGTWYLSKNLGLILEAVRKW